MRLQANNNSTDKNAVVEGESTGFRKNWRIVLSLQFHLLVQAYGICFAMMVTCSTLLNQMMTHKYKTGHIKLIGLMGSIATMIGLGSMLLAGAWIDKTRRYKFISIVVFAAGVVSSLAFILVFNYYNSFALAFAVYCVH